MVHKAFIYVSSCTKRIFSLSRFRFFCGNLFCFRGSTFKTFDSLQNALDFASSQKNQFKKVTVFIENGIYKGQFFFDGYFSLNEEKGTCLKIIGASKKNVLLTNNLAATEILNSGEKRGTFRTYTAYFNGPKVILKNLTIENTAGLLPPNGIARKAGQTIALSASAKNFLCKNVALKAFQDTLFVGPLPQTEREKGGFNGPDVNNPRIATLQKYKKCSIYGTIDFIFGSGSALFSKCEIIVRSLYDSENIDGEKNCYVTAPSCDDEKCPNYLGLVFNKCKVQNQNNSDNVRVFLSRPWRPFGKCVFIKSVLTGIDKEKWHIWNKEEDKKTAFFAEYQNKFTDKEDFSDTFGQKLSKEEARKLIYSFRK